MSERYYDTAVYVSLWDDERHTWGDETLHREACIRQIDGGRDPGPHYQLRMPRAEDPETGDVLDVDGDRSMERLYLSGADLHLFGESLSVTGFAPTSDFGSTFKLARWTQIPYAWIVKREAEAAENAKRADDLSDVNRRAIVALRKHALSVRSSPGDPNPQWVGLHDNGEDSDEREYAPVIVQNFKLTPSRVEILRKAGLVMTTEHKDEWVRSLRRTADTLSVHLLTAAEDIADALIAKEGTS